MIISNLSTLNRWIDIEHLKKEDSIKCNYIYHVWGIINLKQKIYKLKKVNIFYLVGTIGLRRFGIYLSVL